MTLPSLSDYTDLITSEHADKPKFVATVEANVSPFVDVLDFVAALPSAFDLDQAIGVQLDIVGQWVGISRNIVVPLDSPWFSFGIESKGFGRGIWKGPYSATTAISPLDDETYRDLIRAKIAANAWDGTFGTAKSVLDVFFAKYGMNVFVEDRQDMSAVFGVPGPTPSVIMLSIMLGQYIPVKPAGIKTSYVLPSVSDTPIFGFGVSNSNIDGFGVGSWGASPSYLLGIS